MSAIYPAIQPAIRSVITAGLARPMGGGGGAPLPANSRMAAIGDSIAQGLGSATSTNSYNTLNSICGWANMLGGGSLFFPQYGNKGIGGQSIDTIEARFTSDLAPLAPKIIFATGGYNDTDSKTSAAILAKWDSMIAQAAALGAYLVILPITPGTVQVGAADTVRLAVNTGLLSRASSTVFVLDITGYDPLIHTYPEALAPVGYRTHPNVLGCQLLGARLLAIFQSLVQTYDPTLAAGDSLNKLGVRGGMPGTGGTATSATGSVATGWTLDASGAGGATAAGSKLAHPKGGEWQQVVIGGTYSGNSRVVSLTTGSVALSGVAAGELVEVTAEIEFNASANNVDGVGLFAFLQNSGFSFISQCSEMVTNTANNSGNANPGAYSITLRAMPFGHPTTTPAYINLTFSAYLREGGSSSACAATFRIGRVGVRKIVAIAPGMMNAPNVAVGASSLNVTRASDPPNNGSAITGFDLRHSTDQVAWTQVSMTTNPQTIAGLTDGTTYYVQTRAKTAAGDGAWSPSASGVPAWTPLALFAGGVDGYWYEFDDMSTLFQNQNGTTPVTAAGQSVGRVLDKSGNAKHLIARDNTTGRMTYGGSGSSPRYLVSDGASTAMITTGITDTIASCMGLYIGSGSGGYACAARFSTTSTADAMLAREGTTTGFRTGSSLAFDQTNMRINGVATRSYGAANTPFIVTQKKTYSGACTLLNIGDATAGVDRLAGRFYGAIIGLNRDLTTDERTKVEAYVAAKAGVSI